MLITCKCLNVSVSVKGDSIQHIDVGALGLSSNEENDPFFKEDLGTVDLVRISKEQPSLVQMRNIGSWIVHCCLNCSIDSYAINREKGASFVLVSSKLVVDPSEITTLKSSVLYSPVFRIIVNSTTETSLIETKLTAPHMPSGIQAALSALQQQLHESLQRMAQEVEERVRTYCDEQYALLDEFSRRAHDDHRSLAKLLFEKVDGEEKSISGANLRSPPATFDANEAPSLPPPPEIQRLADVLNDSEAEQSDKTPKVKSLLNESIETDDSSRSSSAKRTGSRSARSKISRSARGSLDSEGLFSLEGMDRNVDVVSDEDVDGDDRPSATETTTRPSRTEAVDLPGNPDHDGARDNKAQFARSLPVSVPGFGRSGRDRCHSDETQVEELESIEGLPPEDPMYIAASIKALARSVYGDTPFGELPRPRFSSQI